MLAAAGLLSVTGLGADCGAPPGCTFMRSCFLNSFAALRCPFRSAGPPNAVGGDCDEETFGLAGEVAVSGAGEAEGDAEFIGTVLGPSNLRACDSKRPRGRGLPACGGSLAAGVTLAVGGGVMVALGATEGRGLDGAPGDGETDIAGASDGVRAGANFFGIW